MHIEQVTIKNFRCFEHLEVKLNPDVNVFVGNNGSGKSALLDAIVASIFPYLAHFQSLSQDSSRLESTITSDDLRVAEGNDTEGAILFEISTSDFPKVISTYSLEILGIGKVQIEPDVADEKSSRRLETATLNILDLLGTNHNVQIPLLAYYKGHRSFASIEDIRSIQNRPRDRFASLNGALDAGANFTDLSQWFFLREIQELREAKLKGDINLELDDLRMVRYAVSSVIKPSSQIYFSQEAGQAELRVGWTDEYGNKKDLRLNQLSAGYRNMLALVMDFARRLAQANPGMKNPLEAEAVLLIDEIDLHLHPSWQQRVIPNLREVFPNTQIIATTHSPEVVTTVEQHHVFSLESYQVKDCPSPTRGMKSSEVVRYVLGLDDLRPDTEEKQTLTQLFEAIDRGDIAAAKHFREELKSWESFDSDLTRADMQIRRMERRAST